MRIAIPSKGTKEGRDTISSCLEDEDDVFPAMEEEVVEEERDGTEGRRYLS
ncbi:hypothetical protein L195_g064560, partial [Trifolium pratense]